MKKILLGILLSGVLIKLSAQERLVKDFNDNWKFCKCDAANLSATGYNDAGWENVSTPHTWNALDGEDGGNNYYKGVGWYRKNFIVNNVHSGQRVFVKFNAANMRSDVFVNGALVGNHTGGYSAFTFDITNKILFGGSNLIAVKVNNMDTIKAAPLEADFTFFGGITQEVEIIYTNPVHITPLDYGAPGVYITQRNVSAASADIEFKALIKNDLNTPQNVTVKFLLVNAVETTISTETVSNTVAAGVRAEFLGSTVITNPTLWNGLSNPYLYSVKSQVIVEGTMVDEVIQPLGIRYFSVDKDNGFYLNGSPYRLKGVAHHEDRNKKGRAISDEDRKEDLDILKELGCNYIRLSHYQHGKYAYNYCDSNGIVVWTEIPLINRIDGSQTFTNNAKQQMIELMRQNYNHPSVIVWGLSNEITYKAGPDPSALVLALHELAIQEDDTRLTASAAMHSERALNFHSDIYSCNVYNGWYYNTYNDFGTWADQQRTTFPAKAFGVSEYGAGANISQHEPWNPSVPLNYGQWHPEEYQAAFHEAHWQQIITRPYLWSTSVWVAFDFSSDGRNEGFQPGINDKGLITRDRKIKKDAYYFYKANWNTEPMVHITSSRFTLRYDSVLTAKVYSNCDSVFLKINNVLLSKQTSANTIFTWSGVELTRGSNRIVAIAYENGTPYYDTCYWQFNGPYTINPVPGDIQINFEQTATITPAGYMKDAGDMYGSRGNGYTYGWNAAITANSRERNSTSPKTFDTFMHMQYNNGFNFWEIELPNGKYKVSIVAGEPNFFDSYNAISAEGKLIVQESVYSAKRHAYGTDTVEVKDGRLTIRPATGSGATNAKINFIHISEVTEDPNGLFKSNQKSTYLVYPNPSTGEINIASLNEKSMIRVLDMSGHEQMVFPEVLPGIFTFSSEKLNKGFYMLEIKNSSSSIIEKIIVE